MTELSRANLPADSRNRRLLLIKFIVVIGSALLPLIVLEGGTRLLVFLIYGQQDYGFYNAFTYETFLITQTNDRFLQTYPPKADQFRVLIVGGSTADGMGGTGPPETDWQLPPEVYSREFGKLSGRRVEIINFGQSGHLASQEVVMLALYGIPLKPDLVLVIDGANDIVEMTKGMPPGIPYTDLYVQTAMNRPFFNALLEPLRHSQLVNVINKLRERRGEQALQMNTQALDSMVAGFMRTRTSMAAMAHGVGATFVSVLQPHIRLRKTLTENEKALPTMSNYAYRAEFMQASFRRLSSELMQWQAESNTVVIDATKAFDDAADDCFQDEVHLTFRGNELLLQYITGQLSQAGIRFD
jgi:lysophospholipase L1-like esterase